MGWHFIPVPHLTMSRAITWEVLAPFFSEGFRPGTFQNVFEAQEFFHMVLSRCRSAVKVGQEYQVTEEIIGQDYHWYHWKGMLWEEVVWP